MKTLCMYVGKQFTHFVCAKTVFTPETVFAPKNHLHIQFTQLLSFRVSKASKFTATMGEALIDLYISTLLYGTSRMACTKIVANKDAKWKEIMEILHLNKEDVIKKWKSLRDTCVRHKNIKSKSGDGLSQCKPKWKCYDIMSFVNITLLKQRCVPIYLIAS